MSNTMREIEEGTGIRSRAFQQSPSLIGALYIELDSK